MPAAPYRLIPLRRRDGSVRAYAKVDPDDFAWLMEWRWCGMGYGYAGRKRRVGDRYVTVTMHREILRVTDPAVEVDHINGNKLDNRRSNLRVATHAENSQNKATLSTRGVSWHAEKRRWRARCKIRGREHLIGYYLTADEASLAAAAFRAEHMGFTTN